jgi:C-terminal processing protease CtpA/Prc
VKIERDGQVIEVSARPVPVEEIPWLNDLKIRSAKGWLDARMLDASTGYLKIKTWAPSDNASSPCNNGSYVERFRSELDAAMAKLKDSQDLVLDLRGNGGGMDALSAWLASYFVPDPMRIYVLRYRQTEGTISGDGFGNADRVPASYPRQPGPVHSTRLWVLVDSGSFSATDTLLNILTRNIPDRVTLIGRSSSGGIGGPQTVGTLRNTRGALTVSTCKAFSVCGELLEGAPAEIDYPVQWTRSAIESGRNPDLEAALKLIAEKP